MTASRAPDPKETTTERKKRSRADPNGSTGERRRKRIREAEEAGRIRSAEEVERARKESMGEFHEDENGRTERIAPDGTFPTFPSGYGYGAEGKTREKING